MPISWPDAGIMIQDYQNLSYLKVNAILDPIGCWITPESLNVRGQSFTGTVENNQVKGTFEIRSQSDMTEKILRLFPPITKTIPSSDAFLEPEDFIESDDPVLIKKAEELTAGAERFLGCLQTSGQMGG